MASTLIYFGSDDDPQAERFIKQCIKDAGGNIPLEELKRRYKERFSCTPHIYTGEEVVRCGFKTTFLLIH